MIRVAFDVPVDPNSGQGRQWIVSELSKPEYRAAQPTWFDRLSSAFEHWLTSLKIQSNGLTQTPILLIIAAVVIAAVVAAYFVFGPPRLNRRSAARTLFGEDDVRDAAAMRRAAEDAARRGEFTGAIEEMFRAVARGLAERTIVAVSPGTTATGFARQASLAFPAFADRLTASATTFDRVRYLGLDGTEEAWHEVAALERAVRAARPVLPELAGAVG
jgi:hypothetical protein